MLTTRSLAVSAACAVVLGLAVSGLVRARLSQLEAAIATESPPLHPTGPSADGSTKRDASEAPRDRPAAVEPERRPADLRSSSRTRGAQAKGRSAQPSRRAPSSKPAQDTFSQQLDRGIAKVGERRYEIKRSALDLALANLALLSRSARVAPDLRAGHPFGFRLVAVAAAGPFAKLGLREEDVLVSINGLDLATAEQVLEAYGKLEKARHKARHLVLGLVRDGHETTLEYAIR